ncbi:Heparan-alpha-glucosaminide N-acetyltransferase [Vitis vinifera]|uniref:Heparan-alpha-glucosaminide N-acetyltransferase n=1 Tax=Vitis vinifera TaxID=29760 RepID=A0A438JSG8_VITVI|nr:Heparan-alpha-glucosaminide N-acetyltransferase [Vitis vinifera]
MDYDAKRVEEGLGHVHKEDISEKADKIEKDESSATPAQSVEQKGEEQPLIKQKSKRVATLDAFRGLTIVLMILVDDAGGSYARIDHSPWNGCTLADFVMPFFLFIVGVAVALALKDKSSSQEDFPKDTEASFLGILLQGGYSHAPDDLSYGVDMKHIRWFGILQVFPLPLFTGKSIPSSSLSGFLQRIAVVYFVVALIETLTTKRRPTVIDSGHFSILSAYKWQWIGGFVAFLIYMITTYALYVPDWSFVIDQDHEAKRYTVKCGMRGHLGPACNAVGYVDRQVWGINHLYSQPVWTRLKACTLSSPNSGPFREDAPSWCYAPFEPEGLLSTISAILSGTIGIHYGHVLIHFKGHAERLKQWVSMGIVLLIVAIILHFTDAIPINKQLYSFSYVCFTAGAAGIVLSAFYLVIDVWGFRTPFLFLEWIGMNAMLVFVMAAQGIFAAFINGWYFESSDNSLM